MIIERFGDNWATALELPALNVRVDVAPGRVPETQVELPSGRSVDLFGEEPLLIRPVKMVYAGIHQAADRAAMDAALHAYRALLGVRSRLWRSDGVVQHWRWARCIGTSAEYDPRMGLDQATVRLMFELAGEPWRGEEITIQTMLDTTPKSVVCPNSGTARVTDAVVRVTARSSTITAVQAAITGTCSWTWEGLLAASRTLEVDCGRRTVLVNGEDAYGGFTLGTAHTVADWLRIEPGGSTVTVARTGGGTTSELEIAYREAWY